MPQVVAIGCVSLVLYVIGIAIPYWLNGSVAGISVNSGLWRVCAHAGGISYCHSIPDVAVVDSLKATRAMEILALLVIATAVGCYLLKLYVMKEQNMLPKIGVSLGCISGTLGIAGCVIYGAKAKTEHDPNGLLDLHAGFALCILAAIGAYVSSILFVLKRQR